jgi:hypothetical protein
MSTEEKMASSYSNQFQWTFDLLYNDHPVIPTAWVNITQLPEMEYTGDDKYDPVVGCPVWSPGFRRWKPLSLEMVGPAAKELGQNSDELFVADRLDAHLQKWHGSGMLIGEWELNNVKCQNIEWDIAGGFGEIDFLRVTFFFEAAYYSCYDTAYAQDRKTKNYLMEKMDEFFYRKAQASYEENRKLLKEFI